MKTNNEKNWEVFLGIWKLGRITYGGEEGKEEVHAKLAKKLLLFANFAVSFAPLREFLDYLQVSTTRTAMRLFCLRAAST